MPAKIQLASLLKSNSARLEHRVGVGTLVTPGTVREYGDLGGYFHATKITLTALVLGVVDVEASSSSSAPGDTGGHATQRLYDFPEGMIGILGASCSLAITGSGGVAAGAAVVGSVGTARQGINNATLTSTEADIIPSTTATLTALAGTMAGKSTTALIATFDGTSTAKSAYLNFAIPDADVTVGGALSITGSITLLWSWMGDN